MYKQIVISSFCDRYDTTWSLLHGDFAVISLYRGEIDIPRERIVRASENLEKLHTLVSERMRMQLTETLDPQGGSIWTVAPKAMSESCWWYSRKCLKKQPPATAETALRKNIRLICCEHGYLFEYAKIYSGMHFTGDFLAEYTAWLAPSYRAARTSMREQRTGSPSVSRWISSSSSWRISWKNMWNKLSMYTWIYIAHLSLADKQHITDLLSARGGLDRGGNAWLFIKINNARSDRKVRHTTWGNHVRSPHDYSDTTVHEDEL